MQHGRGQNNGDDKQGHSETFNQMLAGDKPMSSIAYRKVKLNAEPRAQKITLSRPGQPSRQAASGYNCA
jgi:hypothetical protein